MDEIQRKLDFPDRSVKLQGISKLVLSVRSRYKSALPIGENTPQYEELTRLLDKCGDKDPIICRLASDALLSLVHCGAADFHFVLHHLLSITAVAKNLCGIVNILTDMLLVQLTAEVISKEAYRCPFTIRDNPHPFITVLLNRPDCWSLLLQQIHRLLQITNERVADNIPLMLEPFIRYVLLETSPSHELLRSCLPTALLNNPRQAGRLLPIVIDIIPQLETETVQNLGTVIQLLHTVAETLLRYDHSPDVASNVALAANRSNSPGVSSSTSPQVNLTDLPDVAGSVSLYVNHVLPLVRVLLEHATDPSQLLGLVVKVVKMYKQCISSDSVVLHCVSLLSHAPVDCLHSCLTLVLLVLTNKNEDSVVSTPHQPVACNALVVAMLSLPVLQIIASSPDPFNVASSGGGRTIQSLAANIMTSIEKDYKSALNLSSTAKSTDVNTSAAFARSGVIDTYLNGSILSLTSHVANSPPHVINTVARNISAMVATAGPGRVPYQATCLVAAIFVRSSDPTTTRLCLKAFKKICVLDAVQSVQMLPLLLYKLKSLSTRSDCSSSPSISLDVMNYLPKLAVHKMSVGPTLSALSVFASTPKLRPLALRLMTRLWKNDDRCYPHVLRFLHDSSGAQPRNDPELILAAAACMRDICRIRPGQHGEDMLPLLSAVLNNSTKTADSPAACLALDGLVHLCEAEVIDLRTAWLVLAPKLKQDKRSLVLIKVCQLLSLCVQLEVNTTEYQAFMTETVDLLWQLSRHDDDKVCGAAYVALASFPPSAHRIHHLPTHIVEELRASAEKISSKSSSPSTVQRRTTSATASALASTPHAANTGSEDEEEDIMQSIVDGSCYMKLLQTIRPAVLPDFEKILCTVVRNEVSSLPRGLNYSAVSRGQRESGGAGVNRAVSSIPAHIQEQFEQNRSPATRPGRTLGLLLTYNPALPDCRTVTQRTVVRGKHYYQTLNTLLNDVPFDPMDCYQGQVKVYAWAIFMERCFAAYTDLRVCEVQQQLSKDESNMEDIKLLQDGAWLWTRDKLSDLIKGLSKGSSVVQGNCVMALAGLCSAVVNHVTRLDSTSLKAVEALTEHVGHSYWCRMISETIVSLIDPSFVPKGRTMAICNQSRSGSSEGVTAAILARSSAAVAVSLLTSLLVTTNIDLVYSTLDLLLAGLPGVAPDTLSDVLQMYSGIGVALVIQQLFELIDMESSESEAVGRVWKAINGLELSAFTAAPNRVGSLFGLAVVAESICKDGCDESRTYIARLQNELLKKLDNSQQIDGNYEALMLCVVRISCAAYSARIITPDVIDSLIIKTQQLCSQHTDNANLATSYGSLLYCLQSLSHPMVTDLIRNQSVAWMHTVQDQTSSSSNLKLSAITGFVALSGAQSMRSSHGSGSGALNDLGLVNDTVRILKSLMSQTIDERLQSVSVWLAALLHFNSALNATDCGSKSGLPSNYHYLTETSTLRHVIDALIDAGKHGSGDVNVRRRLQALLRTLDTDNALPSLNWSSILSPIIRLEYGDDTEVLCVKLLIEQSSHLPTVARYMASLLVPPLYNSLRRSSQLCLFRHLPSLVKSIPIVQLTIYLNTALVQCFKTLSATGVKISNISSKMSFTNRDVAMMCEAGLIGLNKCLKLSTSQSDSVNNLLWTALKTIYELIPPGGQVDQSFVRLRDLSSQCVSNTPELIVDNLIQVEEKWEEEEGVNINLRALHLSCYLVISKKQPLGLLNRHIERISNDNHLQQSGMAFCMWQLFDTFLNMQSSSKKTDTRQQMDWLGQLMGHCRNVASNIDTPCALRRLLVIFLSAAIAWSGSRDLVLLGLVKHSSTALDNSSERDTVTANSCERDTTSANCSKRDTTSANSSVGHTVKSGDQVYVNEELCYSYELLERFIFSMAPTALQSLLTLEHWTQITGKMIDWLLVLIECVSLSEEQTLHSLLKECLVGLRHTQEYKRVTVWSRAVLL